MVDNKTIIQNPKSAPSDDDVKEFTFDHSYWSFDQNDANFATQSLVFQNLGKDIVSDAIEGYNSWVFWQINECECFNLLNFNFKKI